MTYYNSPITTLEYSFDVTGFGHLGSDSRKTFFVSHTK